MQTTKLAHFSALLIGLSLSGCEDTVPATATEIAASDDAIEVVDCAIGEGSEIGPDCTAERVAPLEGETASVLIIRHPDGGFRRFEQLDNGRGLQVADGADQANLSLDGDTLVVKVAEDQYRFAANVSGREAEPDDTAE